MSVLYTGKVPTVNLSEGVDKTIAILQNHGALELKKRAAQSKALQIQSDKLSKNKAEIAALSPDVRDTHQFASEVIQDGAYDTLSETIAPLLDQEFGYIKAKAIFEKFNSKLALYDKDPDLTEAQQSYQAMINPISKQAIAYNESLGPLHTSLTSLESLQAINKSQFENLLESPRVEWSDENAGDFNIIGEYNGQTINLQDHPDFNNGHIYTPETQQINPFNYTDIAGNIQSVEKAGNRDYNASDVTTRNEFYWKKKADLSDLTEDNEIWQYRYSVFTATKDDIRSDNSFAENMSDEDLFQLFSLEDSGEDQGGLQKLVKSKMENFFKEEMLPLIEYEADEDDDVEEARDAIVQSITISDTTFANQPTSPLDDTIYEDLGLTEGQKIRTALIPAINLSSKDADPIYFPSDNREYHEKMKIFMGSNPPMVRLDPDTHTYEATSNANDDVLYYINTTSPKTSETLQNIVFYEGRPNLWGLMDKKGGIQIIDIEDQDTYTSPMYNSIVTMLRSKLNMTIEDLRDAINFDNGGTEESPETGTASGGVAPTSGGVNPSPGTGRN
tara:strand:+ start:1138 stop:2814 length:1677 start_codon:yes stop_codon:yes gene_type:complete